MGGGMKKGEGWGKCGGGGGEGNSGGKDGGEKMG